MHVQIIHNEWLFAFVSSTTKLLYINVSFLPRKTDTYEPHSINIYARHLARLRQSCIIVLPLKQYRRFSPLKSSAGFLWLHLGQLTVT
jgi:hypothetical protein